MIQFSTKQQRYATGFFTVTGAAFTLLLVYSAWQYSIEQDRKVLSKQSETIAQSITSSLVTTVNSIQNLAMLFRATENIKADEFKIFSQPLLSHHPFIKSAIYMPKLSPGELLSFEEMMKGQGYLTYNLREIPSPLLSKHLQDDIHLPVQFIEPFTVINSTMLGIDLNSHPLVVDAIQRSLTTGDPTIASIPEGLRAFEGMAFIQAIYSGRYEPKTLEERKTRFRGAIAMLIDPQILLPNNISPELEISLTLAPLVDAWGGTIDLQLFVKKEGTTHRAGKLTFTTISNSNKITLTPDLKFIININRKIHIEEASLFIPLLGLFIGLFLAILGVSLVRAIILKNSLLLQQNAEIEQEVLQKTAMLTLVLDTVPVRVYWKDLNGRYLGCNRLFAEDAGCSTTELVVGKTDLQMPWKEQAEQYLNDDNKVLSTGLSKTNYDEAQTTYYGRKIWLKTRKTPLSGLDGEILGTLGVYEDISEQIKAKQRNKELLCELNFKKLALDEHAIVSAADVNGNITYVNEKFLSISGYRRDELMGKNHRMVKSDEHPKEFYQDLWNTITSGRPWHGEVKNLTKKGKAYWVRATVVPFLDENGKPFKYFSIRTDVTSMKELETKLQLAKEEAEAAGRAKSDFLANMSHEIRTPMNAIIGLSHLCLQTELNFRQKDYINKVHNAATSLLRIINDILDFSKIDAGRLDMEAIHFTLEEVLSNMASIISLKAQEKELEFLMETDVDIPQTLVGDPLRLGQILINLANNAIKFTHVGEIAVETKILTKDDKNVRLQFTVRDSGIGMTQEQKAGLFQAFSQADASITRKYGGTGLGLTISKRLIEMMDGNIYVESEAGVGSKFIFDVCLGISDKIITKQLLATADLHGKKVLAVDDNENAIKVITGYMTSFNFQVSQATNGKEAVNAVLKAEEVGEPFELVIMDYMMPEMDGITAATKIRRDLGLTNPPLVIIATAYGEESIIKRAVKDADINGFLVKPINPNALFEAVMEAFGKSHKSDADNSIKHHDSHNREELSGAKILLVEDNEINQQVARELLEQANITVLIAENGKEGIEIVEKESLDGVLMDLQMPVMDGITATGIIRKDPKFANLPILAMTANAMSGDRELCIKAGMQDHISKPIDPINLYSTLSRWIKPANPKPLPLTKNAEIDSSKEEKHAPTLPEIPGIDVTLGVKQIGGNQKAYLGVLAKFVINFEDTDKQIRDALAIKDRKTATRLAHTLKGVSGSIAAQILHKKSAKLESAIDKGIDKTTIETLISEVAVELNNINSAINNSLLKHKDDNKKSFSKKDVEQSINKRDKLIRKLYQQLNMFDSNATDTLETLKTLPLSSAVEKNIDIIKDVVEKYDFENAIIELEKFAKQLDIELQ
ncbi:MAG: response regulator [Magnetococcales bacterium]|nr:response regulator [Magnetococcales bacterium]